MKQIFLLLATPFLVSIIVNGLVELTNVKCNPIDKSFADFEYCFIRARNRSFKYLSLKVKLFKVPIDNITVRIDVRKKANGYKPFLYNISFDACQFMRTRNNPLICYFYGFIEKHSNMNHTCPYDHDIIIEKMDVSFINNKLTNVLPFPQGEYALYTTWSAYNIPRAFFNVFVTLK